MFVSLVAVHFLTNFLYVNQKKHIYTRQHTTFICAHFYFHENVKDTWVLSTRTLSTSSIMHEIWAKLHQWLSATGSEQLEMLFSRERKLPQNCLATEKEALCKVRRPALLNQTRIHLAQNSISWKGQSGYHSNTTPQLEGLIFRPTSLWAWLFHTY